MKHFEDDELTKFNDTLKPTVARKIGEASMDTLSDTNKQRLTQFALKHVVRTTLTTTCSNSHR